MSTMIDPRLAAVKQRQQATWASGDYSAVATLIVPVAEQLVDLADLRAGSTVLDVATGSGTPRSPPRASAAASGSTTCRPSSSAAANAPPRSGSPSSSAPATRRRSRSPTAPSTQRSRSSARCSPRTSRGPPASSRASPGPAGRSRSRAGRRTASSARSSRPSGHTSPPPPGLASPLLWGTEDHLGRLFAPDVDWTHDRTFTFRFTSAQAFVDTFAEYYGPTVKAHRGRGRRPRALVRTCTSWRPSGTGSSSRPGRDPRDYLESVGTRR